MEKKPCIELHFPELSKRRDELVATGKYSIKEASIIAATEEHQRLFKDLQDFKKKIGVSTEKYVPFDSKKREEEVKKINDKYNPLIEEKKNGTKGELPLPKKEEPIIEGSKDVVREDVPLATDQKPNQKADAQQNKKDEILNPEKKGDTTNEPPNKNSQEAEGGEGEKIGVHHAALTDLANKLGLPLPQTGEYFTPREHAERGRIMMNEGADVNEIDNKSNDLHDRISIGRANLEKLNNELNTIRKDKGANSDEYKQKEAELQIVADKVKKLGSAAGQAMTSLQGVRDVDTDNFEAVKRSAEEILDKPLTKLQEIKVQELTDRNEALKKRAEEIEAKLITETEKAFKEGYDKGKGDTKTSPKNIKEKAKNIAVRLRDAKVHRPNSFSAATPASLIWDSAIEVVAKSIEVGGSIAYAIDKGITHIKESDWYKGLTDDKKEIAENDFYDWHNEQTGLTNLQDKFINKKKNDLSFTPDEGRAVWDFAKAIYLDRGISFREMIQNVSNDTGLSYIQVAEAISTKKTKEMSDKMWEVQSELKKGRKATEDWVLSQNKGKIREGLKTIMGVFRGISVFGHGAIFVGTHAGATLFDPKLSRSTQRAFLNGWRFAYGSNRNYELAMDEFKNRGNYLMAQRAGLKNNPERINVEEFQKSQDILRKMGLGKVATAGERGFNAIKVLRQDIFDYEYSKISEIEKNDKQSIIELVKLINNATGATNLKVPEVINEVTFAGGMEATRWARLTTNPAKATSTALEIILGEITGNKTATISQKVFAKVWGKRVGRQVVTYAAILGANAAMQKLINPNNPTNLTNPNDSDFLKFKFGNLAVDPTSGMRATASFIYGLGKIPFENKKQLYGDTRGKAFAKSSAGYLRGKLSPGYGTLVDFYTSQDFNGNTMPYSNEKANKGKTNLSWGEYAFQKAPLPIAEAASTIYKSVRENKADESMTKLVMEGISTGALSGSTGFRVSEAKIKKGDINHAKSFTIYNKQKGTKRLATQEEADKTDNLKETIYNNLIKKILPNTKIKLDTYGDPTISEKEQTAKTKLYNLLSPDDKEKLNKSYKNEASRLAKEKLFGKGAHR